MAIPFSDNFRINVGAPIDSKYLNSLNEPYTGTSQVLAEIVWAQRYIGLTVNVNNVEYWFSGGTDTGNLVIKTAGGGGGGGTITGGTNGLHVEGKNIVLGGSLTGDTIIGDAVTEYHLKYGNNYALNYSNRSLVDKEYVDSIMSGTQYHIPVFTPTGNQIIDSTLIFTNNKLSNNDTLTIDVPDGETIQLIAADSGSGENVLTLGMPSLDSGITKGVICVAGQAANIGLDLRTKGSSAIINITSPTTIIGADGTLQNSLSISQLGLRLARNGMICGHDGIITSPDALPITFIGGRGYSISDAGRGGDVRICGGQAQDGIGGTPKAGGDVILDAGLGASGGDCGRIKLCNLPLQSTETTIVYVDASGNLSVGLGGGGAGLYNLDSPAIEHVGGIIPNSPTAVLTGKTAFCILKDMLVPQIFGLITEPSTSMVLSPNGLKEIGEIIPTVSVTGTLNRGSINPQGMSLSPYRVNAVVGYTFTGADMPSGMQVSAGQTVSNYTVIEGPQTWTVQATHTVGVQPLGSKGTPFNSPKASGLTANIASQSITGILPWFWGKSSISNIDATCITTTGNKVVANVTSAPTSVQITFNSGDEDFLWFALPACAETKNKWWSTSINYGTIGDRLFLTPVSMLLSESTGRWSNQAYDVYKGMYKSRTDLNVSICVFYQA